MAGNRRSNQVEMNFDGLTDAVTNLVGALVLIVVLLIGVTRDAVYSAPTGAETAAAVDGQQSNSIELLLQQLEIVREQSHRTDVGIRRGEAELRVMRSKVQQLLNKPE